MLAIENTSLFVVLLALLAAVVTWMLAEFIFSLVQRNKIKVQQRLAGTSDTTAARPGGPEYRAVVAPRSTGESRAAAFKPIFRFQIRLLQVYPETTLGRFASICACIAASMFILVGMFSGSLLLGLLVGVASIVVMIVAVNFQYQRRRQKLDDQLPDALDFLARVLRAGHSLSTGLRMVGQELPNPISTEFRRCYNQHSVGQSIEETMKDLATRVESPDFSFFVTAVLIQRQTGGNLAEVLDNIADMVRARLRLQQKLKAVTAEGRMTGYFLAAFPLFMFFMLLFVKYDYESVLFRTPAGRLVGLTVLVMQFVGLLVIRKIVDVKM
jgi:tight adherence protein B